jgi:hypothetical protein
MPGHACALTSRFAVVDIVRESELTGLRDHDTQGANDLEQCGALQCLNGGLTDESDERLTGRSVSGFYR